MALFTFLGCAIASLVLLVARVAHVDLLADLDGSLSHTEAQIAVS